MLSQDLIAGEDYAKMADESGSCFVHRGAAHADVGLNAPCYQGVHHLEPIVNGVYRIVYVADAIIES